MPDNENLEIDLGIKFQHANGLVVGFAFTGAVKIVVGLFLDLVTLIIVAEPKGHGLKSWWRIANARACGEHAAGTISFQ